MGAVFVAVACQITKNHAQAKEALGAMPNDEIYNIVNEWHPVDTEAEAREIASDAVDDVYAVYNGFRRDGQVMFFGSKPFVVTGGMTWGDSPTDVFDSVTIIATLGVTK